MKYKLLALDIDGTIVKEHTNEISTTVLNAIQAAKEKITIALVSARAKNDQEIIVKLLGLENHYHVIENGTKVMNPNGELEYTKYLPNSEVKIIYSLTRNICESIGYCIDGKWSQQPPNATGDSVTTLSLIARKDKAEDIPSLLDKMHTTYSLTIGNHWNDSALSVALISHKEASKGGGLRYIQQKLGISVDETIAVGDGASDVPMMKYASVKVAMGNAEDKLKKIATHTVSSVSEDGVADVISQFILTKRS